ncbi:MAG: DNA-processing protein DprA [Firmicutes bacterium]|nr:DNA-processing protein DprA [Bacillota bacterium]
MILTREKYAYMWLGGLMNIPLALEIERNFTLDEIISPREEYFEELGIKREKAASLEKSAYKFFEDKNIQYIKNTMEKEDIVFISKNDEDYPEKLSLITEPPMGIYLRGEKEVLKSSCAAVVGSRRVSDYGVYCCEKFSGELAEKGVVIVSGMAEGTDSHAHKAALAKGGKTVAVMGNGIDICYPACNRNLRENIVKNGCIISEFPLSMRGSKWTFPYRNRIISGLSDVVLIMEAAKKSGSIITAGHALDQGKSVFALPGNITSSLSEGSNILIKEGAFPLLDSSDVLYELGIEEKESAENKKNDQNLKITLETTEQLVYDCMDCGILSADEISYKTKLDIQTLMYTLTTLELKGVIKRVHGQKYIKGTSKKS